MALRPKDKRIYNTNPDDLLSPNLRRRRRSNPKIIPVKDHLPNVLGSADRLYAPAAHKAMKHENHSPNRTQVIVVACQRHPEEFIKFIDVSTSLFNSHCEACIVSSGSNLKQIKLERVNDLQTRVKKLLKHQLEQLKALEQRVDSMTKEIKISNALLTPIMGKIEYMEKQTYIQIDALFKKLRHKFTRNNPFKNTKDSIQEKLEDVTYTLQELSSHDEEALESLKETLKVEPKMKEEMKNFVLLMNNRLENASKNESPHDKDVGIMENAFDDFIEGLTIQCEKFAKIVER